jgi:hypothetical protein
MPTAASASGPTIHRLRRPARLPIAIAVAAAGVMAAMASSASAAGQLPQHAAVDLAVGDDPERIPSLIILALIFFATAVLIVASPLSRRARQASPDRPGSGSIAAAAPHLRAATPLGAERQRSSPLVVLRAAGVLAIYAVVAGFRRLLRR